MSYSGSNTFSEPLILTNGFSQGLNTLEFRTINTGSSPSREGFRALLSGTGLTPNTNALLASGRTTYYFRQTFNFASDPTAVQLRLNPLVADGAVFYLNGVEVYRQNMPAGSISASTPALSNVVSPTFSGGVAISASSLLVGTNLLAVEVHQAAANTGPPLAAVELIATPLPFPPLTLAFNELSGSTNDEFWLELVNRGTNPVPLDGYVIYRDGDTNNDSQYVFPPGSPTLASGQYFAITNSTLGFHPSSGEKLFLYAPDHNRVADSVVVKKAHRGRFPDGTGDWLYPNVDTPRAANRFAFHHEIVINEIMYHHSLLPATNGLPPESSPEEWVELFNRGANTIDLTGWELSGGISYHFTPGKAIGPGAYLVVAKDAAALHASYPAIDIVGDFSGKLANDGDLIVLTDSSGNPANQVHYYTDGRWPKYPDGGGSSLELRDPNADNSQPQAWAASDESTKSTWQSYSYRATANIPPGSGQPTTWNDFICGLLSDGECLIDDISVVDTTSLVPFISNGNFENGLTGWRVIGNHVHSRWEVDPDNPGNHVLHVIATGPQEHMHNHIETSFNPGLSVQNGAQYQISFRTKWLAGNNLLNTRLYFNRVARTTTLPRPGLHGTPGARNSRFSTNIGPTFSQFQHRPVIPQAGEAVRVSVLAQDPQSVGACEVWWSVNGGSWSHGAMTNVAGALYAGIIPGATAGATVQFYVRGTDGLGAVSTYPAAGPDSGALYAVASGQPNPAPTHTVRLLLTPANISLLHAFTNVMSNDNLPCTVIYDDKRAYYDLAVRLKGSERGRYNDVRVSFHLEFQPDDLFRGVHPVMLIDRSGEGDAAVNRQEEILVKHMLMRAGAIPGTYSDICRLIGPKTVHTGPALFFPRFEDEFIQRAYDHGEDGSLWEMEMIYYPTTASQGYKNPQPDQVIGTDISDLGDDKEIYRYNFIIKNHRAADEYRSFINFAKPFSLNGAELESKTREVMDVNEWLRSFALITLCGVSDGYTFGFDHNLFLYLRPSDQKMLAFPWDLDFCFGRNTIDPLVGDRNLSRIINLPSNLRLFYAHILDIMAISYNTSYMNYWAHRYEDFCPGQTFAGRLSYIESRAAFARTTINNAGGNTPFSITSPNPINSSTNLIAITGTAPIQVQTIKVNGNDFPITWSSISGWTIFLPVSSAINLLTVQPYDFAGNALSNLATTVTVNYSGPIESAPGKVVINEIMYNPPETGASFVEIYNASSQFAFHLGGWRFNGLDYTFPSGTILGPGKFLVLAKDRTAFASAYGTGIHIFDLFDGSLQNDGETLTLIKPGATPPQDLVIDKVRYDGTLPWPTCPNGGGFSLQLLDASQDNARVSNWGDGLGWRFAAETNTIGSMPLLIGSNVFIFLQGAGEAYVDDVSLVPTSGPYAGTNMVRNGDFEAASLSGTWSIPPTMPNSALSRAFAHSGSNSLYVAANSAPATPSFATCIGQSLPVVLSPNTICILSFWYRTGYSPTTNSVVRMSPEDTLVIDDASTLPVLATPGTNNSITTTLPPYPLLWINELQLNNVSGITDALGHHEPWLELYNAGSTALALDGFFLANNYTNLPQWRFPAGSGINAGEFKIIFADGQPGETTTAEWHTSFRLSSTNGAIALSRSYLGQPQIVDYVNYPSVPDNLSYGSLPDGQPFERQQFYYVTPGRTNNGASPPAVLFINEWMASNTRTLADLSSGTPKYDDWFEIYNPATNAVNLAGYFMTDNPSTPSQYQVPSGYTIPAGGFLLVWADGEPNQNGPTEPNLHVNFSLNKSGEAIGLYAPDGTRVDAVLFGPQTNDISQGRCPDGGTNIVFLASATPRAANNCAPANTAPRLAAIGNKYVHQDQTLTFTATATDAESPPQTLAFSLGAGAPSGASINPGSGVFTWPTTGVTAPSTNALTVRVTDNGTPSLSDSQTIALIVLARLHFSQLTRSGDQLSLTWDTAPGQTYRLEYTDNLSPPAWMPLGNDRFASGSTLSATVNTTNSPHTFYRLRILQ